MPVETITPQDFEKALKATGIPFKSLGLVQGEMTYLMAASITPVQIMVRSSIKADGLSAEVGQDSIRAWLTYNGPDGPRPLGSKTQSYVTRQAGWENRLAEMVTKLNWLREQAGDCQQCGQPLAIFKAKQGGNKGKFFSKCMGCQKWTSWLEGPGKKAPWYNTDGQQPTQAQKPELRTLTGKVPTQQPASSLSQEMAQAQEATQKPSLPILCPKCGLTMQSRTRRSDGAKFWGCPGFPQCKGTRNGDYDPINDPIHPHLTGQQAQKDTGLGFTPSKYQEAIFDFIQNGTGHGLVQAVAGSGKTTTNVAATQYIRPGVSYKFVAFNRHIAKELKARGVDGSTFHSLGYGCIKASLPEAKMEEYKVRNIIDGWQVDEITYDIKGAIERLVGLMKAKLMTPSIEAIFDLAENYDIDIDYPDPETVAQWAITAFHRSIQDKATFDYDDMIYFPATGMVKAKKYDMLLVDEAQDLNPAQVALALVSITEKGRILVIGDRYQSIYAFAGAAGSMDHMAKKLAPTELPLSITYRCPKAVVELVNAKFSYIDFEASEQAIQGEIFQTSPQDFLASVQPEDGVICRTNAPLVKPCFDLIRRGIKATIRGRDIGQQLVSMIEKRQKQDDPTSLTDLLEGIDRWFIEQRTRLIALDKLARLAAIEDRVDTIYAIAEESKTIGDLKNRIKSIFADDKPGVVFSSIHRAKGLEWNKVFILEPGLMPHPMAQKPLDREQEKNIEYVAYTRAKSELHFVV